MLPTCGSCGRVEEVLMYGHLHHYTVSGGPAYKCTNCGRSERETAQAELATVRAAHNEFAVVYYIEQIKFFDNLLSDRL
jgi:hypothetical protein